MTLPIARLLSAATVCTAALAIATPSFAGTITFGSAATGVANGAITYNNTGANAPQNTPVATTGTATVLGNYQGFTLVSYDPNTGSAGDNNGTTVYTTTYTGNLAGDTGSISLIADDSAVVFLNGVQLGGTTTSNYLVPATFNIGAGVFQNGLNTFTFNVLNGPVGGSTSASGGPTDFGFTATAATPEPSSLIMLGTGILGAAGTIRRRFNS